MIDTDFDIINKQIQDFIKDNKQNFYELKDKQSKLPLSDCIFCAEDVFRNRVFRAGIKSAINKIKKNNNDKMNKKDKKITVVDAGSGTGVLGIFALILGADMCYFLEDNPYSISFSKKLIAHLGLNKKSQFIKCDATSYKLLPENYDLLISETIVSNLADEDFVKIVNNLTIFANEKSIILPSGFKLKIQEKDHKSNTISEHNVDIFSQMMRQKKKIKISKSSKKLNFSMHVNVHEDIWIKPGECMSFANDTSFDLDNQHPLFEFVFSE